MKKFNLLLLAVCCGMTAMAADFEWNSSWVAPSQCSSTNNAYEYWYGNAAVPDPMPEHKEVVIMNASEGFDAANDFDELWNAISSEENAISNLVGGTATNSVISWKGTYDTDNIYILIKAEKETSASDDIIEICVAPYFTIANTPAATDAYVRYLQFGAWKAEMKGASGAAPGICTGDIATQAASGALVVNPSWRADLSGNDAKWIVTIPYLAISGDDYAGFCDESGMVEDITAWNALSDGKGINFDIKYADVNGDAKAEYWWNTKDNNAFQSTAFCGFVKAGTNIAIDGAENDVISNMTIAANQIKLAEPADVKIMNAAGMLIKSVNDATEVSTFDLPAGTYIVVAGNETATFVK